MRVNVTGTPAFPRDSHKKACDFQIVPKSNIEAHKPLQSKAPCKRSLGFTQLFSHRHT
jgi:hypothetical protein